MIVYKLEKLIKLYLISKPDADQRYSVCCVPSEWTGQSVDRPHKADQWYSVCCVPPGWTGRLLTGPTRLTSGTQSVVSPQGGQGVC